MNCDFYLLKALSPTAYQGYKYAVGDDGGLEFIASPGYIGTGLIPASSVNKKSRLVQLPPLLTFSSAEIIQADENERLITKTTLDKAGFVKLEESAQYFTLSFQGASYTFLEECSCFFGYQCVPHYKKLALKYSREASQIFFRKALDGKITLHREDFQFVAQSGLEDKLLFNMYREGQLISANWFNKTDCKIDQARGTIELKFFPEDRYTKILDAYENTFDLIRCAPALSKLQLTKRMAYQIYQAGGDTITSYFAGTYYEDKVQEVIDSESALQNKFYFTKLRNFTEATLSGFSVDSLNTVFIINGASTKWAGRLTGGEYGPAIIRLEKKSEKGATRAVPTNIGNPADGIQYLPRLSDGEKIALEKVEGSLYVALYDTYQIIISVYDGMYDIYTSTSNYADDKNGQDFSLSGLAEQKYQMATSVASPSSFYLSDFLYSRSIWARCLADVDTYTSSSGGTISLYDIPADDFAISRGNYKKCIGLSDLTLWQSDIVQATPTKYGIDDFGNYFTSNFLPTQATLEKPMPVARSNWGNTSTWVTESEGYKKFEQSMRKQYTLKDAYTVADVIKALLLKIDSSLSFEASAEYSSFLYATPGSYGLPLGYSAYITPKSNVLKGDYDQAARKAELTFKELMDMLRDCFRCYWFVDEQNRFRVEHISYFTSQSSQLDLTNELDKFTKKNILFAQSEITFDKKDLPGRYEFNWMDDATDLFGNFTLDVNSRYVQKDKHEEIIASKFSSDVDFMMLFPEKFSEDGFALIIAEASTGVVPIVQKNNLKDDEFKYPYDAEIQNYYASWLHLINYYMKDMPARNISYTSLAEGSLVVEQLKRSMTNEVVCPGGFSLDISIPITTSFGPGTIEELEINVDTEQASITLSYVPA